MGDMPPLNKLLSVPEAAEAFDYNAKHLSRLASQGKVKAWKLGKNWVTTREAMQDYVKSNPSAGRPKQSTRKRKK